MEDKGNPGDDSLRRELGRRILECCERDTELLRINQRIAETVSRYIDELLRQVGRPFRYLNNKKVTKSDIRSPLILYCPSCSWCLFQVFL